VRALPLDFGRVMRERLRRGWETHANRGNPYAALLLEGKTPPEPERAPRQKLEPTQFVCADAAEFLESAAPGSFDGFALSNISDGATEEYMQRLRAAIDRAAAPGAVAVKRSFAEPGEMAAENFAVRDRSMLWGVVEVRRVGGERCCIS
jgi:hypothetical protein